METLNGMDTIRAGTGHDVIRLIHDTSYSLGDIFDGGSGSDTIMLGNMLELDLTAAPNSDIINVEIIDIGERAVSLEYDDVVAISSTTNTLRIDSSIAPGTVNVVDAGWVQGADQMVDGATYHSYTKQVATLLIDADAFINFLCPRSEA